jgi:hypothetical protein
MDRHHIALDGWTALRKDSTLVLCRGGKNMKAMLSIKLA